MSAYFPVGVLATSLVYNADFAISSCLAWLSNHVLEFQFGWLIFHNIKKTAYRGKTPPIIFQLRRRHSHTGEIFYQIHLHSDTVARALHMCFDVVTCEEIFLPQLKILLPLWVKPGTLGVLLSTSTYDIFTILVQYVPLLHSYCCISILNWYWFRVNFLILLMGKLSQTEPWWWTIFQKYNLILRCYFNKLLEIECYG
jgi:hypothetical protein